MKIIDAGHKCELGSLDGDHHQVLQYVKRDTPPENYPRNVGSYPGTTMQEVCRAQIHRALYVNGQIECAETREFVEFQRHSILVLERRAARLHGRVLYGIREEIENEPTCSRCGHIQCGETCKRKARAISERWWR